MKCIFRIKNKIIVHSKKGNIINKTNLKYSIGMCVEKKCFYYTIKNKIILQQKYSYDKKKKNRKIRILYSYTLYYFI